MKNIIGAVLIIVCVVQCNRQDQSSPPKVAPNNQANIETVKATYDAFGINISGFKIRDLSVKKNESLYLMLQKLELDEQQIYRAIQKAKRVIDVRSFKPRQAYRAYLSKKNNELEKMVWEPNDVEFVTFDWQQDSLQIYRASRAVTMKSRQVSGTINSSLYNALSGAESRDKLVYKMSDIFAWQVDFFNLRKGDTFKILYEDKFVEDRHFDVGEILAVELEHMGDTYTAYRYENKEIDGYYDKDGKSVQKALLKAPFTYDQRISSGFDPNRFHPVLKRRRAHNGVDYAAPYGTPILSVGDGTVRRAGYYGAAGRMVEVEHNNSYKTEYMHMSKFASGVRSGTHVKQGEVIGYVGNSGRVTGTHLHYGMYRNNRPINPLTVDLPPAKSLPQDIMPNFKEMRNNLNLRLFNQDTLGITVPLTE